MVGDLIKHLNALGFYPKIEKLALDGSIHRFDRDGKLNGWIIGFQNHNKAGIPYIVAQFGDWKTGEEDSFHSSVKMTAGDKKIMYADIEKAKAKVKIEKEQEQLRAADEAQKFFETASENPNSDYLKIKQIKGLYGAKTVMQELGRALVIPYRDVDGKMWGYQTIRADRTKRFGPGQKKSGNFHVIPFIEALLDQSTVYVAEGFATAASIYEATGLAVVVAFDSGNLIKVCKALKSKYNDKAFIICGDDDKYGDRNVGRECAEEAAKSVLGEAIFPKFKDQHLKPTDFNDLHLSEGLEVVKNQILKVKPEFNTVSCLGYQDDIYYFISTEKPNVTAISKGSFSKNTLIDLMQANYWERRFPHPKKFGMDLDKAIDTMMLGCRKVGKFLPRNVRGAGVWQDQKRTVVNLGDALWVDGELKEYREFKSKYIYQAAERINVPREDFLDAMSVKKLNDLLHKLSWKSETYPKLLLGWLMIAPICGSLNWRPHIWITGPSGSGKTTVMQDILGKIVGRNATKIMGRSSEAGIRQEVMSDAKPLLFDENETTDKKSEGRVASVIELFRQASSETDSHVVKGTISGKSIAFNIRFAAAISSIRVGLTLEQDINRFSVLEMYNNKNNGFTEAGGTREQLESLITPEFCERFVARSVRKLPLIQENFKILYKFLQRKVSGRFADQYGTLIAGYYAAIQDDSNFNFDADFDLSDHIEVATVKDEDECLDFLLSSKLADGGKTFSVGEIIKNILDHNTIDLEEKEPTKYCDYIHSVLMRHGMKVKDGFLFVQMAHPELSKLFFNSKWPAGWGSALLRISNSKSFTGWIHSAVKGVLVEIKEKLTC